MTGIANVRSGLEAGLAAVESLRTWVETPAGHDLVDWRGQQIRDALKALAEVERHLKPCTLPHVAITYDAPSACYCNAVSNPPCNWCTDGGDCCDDHDNLCGVADTRRHACCDDCPEFKTTARCASAEEAGR